MSYFNLKGNTIVYDTETTGLNSYGSFKRYGFFPARPFAFALCDLKGNSHYIRWEVDPFTREVIPEKHSKKELSEAFADPRIIKVGHNLLFDIRMSRKSGIKFDWSFIHDTQFMAHCLTGGSYSTYALKPLADTILGIDDSDQVDLIESVHKARRIGKDKGWCIATEEYFGKQPYKSDYWLGKHKLCKKYALGDVERTLLLYLIFKENFEDEPQLHEIYKKEIRLSKVMYHTEKRGVRVFKKYLNNDLKIFYEAHCKKWLKVAYKNGGKDLNFNSPKQLVQKFCIEKGYTTENKTATGAPSIDADQLALFAKKDKLAKAILEYKTGQSMESRFIKNYNKYMVYEDGCWVLHPNYRQVGTKTGRLSCSNPNLMGVSDEEKTKVNTELGLRPREALGPRKGYCWYLPDYSQMEVWVFAFSAQYKFMMDLLLKGKDFHLMTAKQIWGKNDDWEVEITAYRAKGKTIMFLKIYGGGVKAVKKQLVCSFNEAQECINAYDAKLPGVKEYIIKMTNLAERQGYILNAFGRKNLYRSNDYYKAPNHFVQGTCADIMKNILIRLNRIYVRDWPGTINLLTLHDELVIEVPLKYDRNNKLAKRIIKTMQIDSAKAGIPVPLPVTMKKTYTKWSDAKKVVL